MKRFLSILISLLLIMLLTSCEKTTHTIGYQIITTLEDVPAQLSPMVNLLQNQEGVYTFNAEAFGLSPETYVLIGLNKVTPQALTVKQLKTEDRQVYVTLAEDTSAAPQPFVLLKILYDGPITVIHENETAWLPMVTDNLYFSLQGNMESITSEQIVLKTDLYTFKAPISLELAETLDPKTLSKYTENAQNQPIIVDYSLTVDNPEVFNLNQIVEQGEVEGIYIGQIDNRSIEVKTAGSYKAYNLTASTRQFLQTNQLEPNTPILLTYYMTEKGYRVITNMQLKP